jgi:hypothetical protein
MAAGDHRVAILELDEAAIHRAARETETELAFPAQPVPAIDVRGGPPSPVFINLNMRPQR